MQRGVVVVLPIRSFDHAKDRLASSLDPAQRAQLARTMAERVVAAAGSLPVVVVSSAPEVRAWCAELGLVGLDDPGTLDAAVAAGRDHAATLGAHRVLVVHGDLPHARTLAPVADDPAAVVLVPCHRDDGTNVVSVPTDAPFRFAYGPGSFARHREEAERLGLPVQIVRDPDLAFDVDTPADLELMHLEVGHPGG